MERNISLKEQVEFIGVPLNRLGEVKEVLKEKDIPINIYENAHSVLSDAEARFTADRIQDPNESDFYIPDLSDEDIELFVDNLYNDLNDTVCDECGIYDNDRLYEIELNAKSYINK